MKKLGLVLLLLWAFTVFGQEESSALLLFTREENGFAKLYVLNATTGEERLLTEVMGLDLPTEYDFGWSPDGKIWLVTMLDGNLRLQFIDPTSGETTLFSENFGMRTCASAIEWSPDGRYMSYRTVTDDKSKGLTIYQVEDGTSYTLAWIGDHFPYWSPDGNSMMILDNYFMTYEDAENAKTRLLLAENGSELLRRGDDTNAFNFAFSPDSRFFAYEEADSAWVYEITTGTSTNLEIPTDLLRWSPSSRYLLIGSFPGDLPYAAPMFSYDTQTGLLSPLELDSTSNFAAWLGDENTFLLRSDFQSFGDRLYPQSLLSYQLESNNVAAISQANGADWFGEVSQAGSWIAAIKYLDFEANEGRWANSIRFINGATVLEFELSLNYLDPSFYTHTLSWSPDGRWLSISADDGLYRFDTLTRSFEQLTEEADSSIPFWSPDSRYLAFRFGEELRLWNTEDASLETLPEGITEIVGWQDGNRQTDVTCRRGYSDGNP